MAATNRNDYELQKQLDEYVYDWTGESVIYKQKNN
jgi:hypothetical protein